MDVSRYAPVYGIGAVRTLTGLSDRQIRYYDETGLVVPTRTRGNRRLYSKADVDALEFVKRLLTEGRRVAEVKEALAERATTRARPEPDNLIRSSDALARFGETVSLRSVYPLANRPELLKTLDSLSGHGGRKENAKPHERRRT